MRASKKAPLRRARGPAKTALTIEGTIYHVERLIVLLVSDDPIDRVRRDAIAEALNLLRITLKKKAAPRGRRIAEATWVQAAIVDALVTNHGADLKGALAIAAGDKVTDYRRVERAYSKLKAGKAPVGVHVTKAIIDSLAARLRPSRRHGNK